METDSMVTRVMSNIRSAIYSLTYKKDKKIVIVGSWFGEKFADNSRFLFQYLAENKSELGLDHVVWVTSSADLAKELTEYGYEAVVMGSEESNKWHKQAYYHIICNSSVPNTLKDVKGNTNFINSDIQTQYSFRSKRINLWHGTGGLKAVGMASNSYKKLRAAHPLAYKVKELLIFNSKFYQLFFGGPGGWGRCYQIATSPLQVETLHSSQGRPKNMCIETSYPRNCRCPRLLPHEETVLDEFSKYSYVVLYLPTFRTNSSYHYEDLSKEVIDVLQHKNILWVEKSHSAEKVNVSKESIKPNVIKLNPDFDINVLLPYITILLTDYSSVRMDAMFHNKATLFYVPDFDDYCAGDNGFMADPNEVLCGPRLCNVSALREALEKYIDHPESSKSANYYEIRNRYWSKNRSLAEIWQDILDAVN